MRERSQSFFFFFPKKNITQKGDSGGLNRARKSSKRGWEAGGPTRKSNQRKEQLRPKNAKARTLLIITHDEKHGQHWRVTHCTLHPGPVPSCPGQLGSGSEVGSPRLTSTLRHRLRYRLRPRGAPGAAPAHFPTLSKRILSLLWLCSATLPSQPEEQCTGLRTYYPCCWFGILGLGFWVWLFLVLFWFFFCYCYFSFGFLTISPSNRQQRCTIWIELLFSQDNYPLSSLFEDTLIEIQLESKKAGEEKK